MSLLAIEEIFAADGPLARGFAGYEPRAEQLTMAREVARAFRDRSLLLAEAGTGTGKTLAYAVPALLSGQKVVISTATKNLQEQVAYRDLPRVAAALGLELDVQVLKGRQNYLCLHRLARANVQPGLRFHGQLAPLAEITRWAETTQSGDRAELKSLPDDFAPWREIDARSDSCLGARCKLYDPCFVTQARARAEKAEVIVVNHHLFFADLALRWLVEKSDSPIIPDYDAVVFDEAHTLEQVVTEHFGVTFSEGRVLDLGKDGMDVLPEGSSELFGPLGTTLTELATRSAQLFHGLGSGPARRPLELDTQPSSLFESARELAALLDKLARLFEQLGRAEALASRAKRMARELRFVLLPQNAAERGDFARMIEERARTLAIRALPLDVSNVLAETLFKDAAATVLCSATLSIAGDFGAVRERLGIDAAREVLVSSPFDYGQQALIYLPQHFPEPAAPDYGEALTQALLELCEASAGGAFLLFTSLRMMSQQAEALRRRLPYPVLVQGEAPKSALLDCFVQDGSSVLFASQSFWEGVDVPGQALRLVVIDKLPFGSPADPLLAARLALAEREGRRGFELHQLPDAILSLRQGFGRLIRTPQDRGVVALMDVRLRRRAYGRKFLAALPAAPLTAELGDVRAFFCEPVAPVANIAGAK